MEQSINVIDQQQFQENFLAQPANRLLQNAISQSPYREVAVNRRLASKLDHTFSHHLGDWEVTHQKKTGRCWMFAGLNLLRVGTMQQLGLKNFEFSQCYLFFWDKFERSNYLLEAILETANRDIDDRTVNFLLSRPIEDGGQWHMFVNLVNKYGLVPKSFMPETISSSDSIRMNEIIALKIRETASAIRKQFDGGRDRDWIRAHIKQPALQIIYNILSVHLGSPPEIIDWQWRDDQGEFHRDGETTPQEFVQKYTTVDVNNYVCLVNDSRASSPLGQAYSVEFLGNVIEADPVIYLNVDLSLMKSASMDTIIKGEPVWFGCDAGKLLHRSGGIWDANMYEVQEMYDVGAKLDRSDRLLYQDSLMTHAMLFTGVDVVDDYPRRWRVENSWGDDGGEKGFYLMQDNWFDEYMYEVAIHKDRLPKEIVDIGLQKPTPLPPWDPMGALAF